MRGLIGLVVAFAVGCGVAGQLPRSGLRASSAGASDAVCVCRKRAGMPPQWAVWADTHEAWHCTVLRPRDGSVPVLCDEVNTHPPAPAGFELVTP